nr:reverse transcriptase domain-containing protein [Tanacetum cinerariifolium]
MKKLYSPSLSEQIFAPATQQMLQIQKRSSGKQNLSANRERKHKSINGIRSEQGEQVRLGTIIGMIRGNTSNKRPREQSVQWLDNEISFPSTLGCQLVDSRIILKALIEGFQVRRIYVDEGSSSEVMYKHCLRNLGAETRAKLKESSTLLVGCFGEVSYPIGTVNLNVTMGESERLRTIPMEFVVVKSHSPYNVILGRTVLRSLGVIESLMGFKYKCFLDAYKGYQQIQMTKKDKEKTSFYTDEGVFCYMKMPFGLKNARATYQRLVDTIFEGQMGRNLEAYVDDMVIKSKTEPEMIKEVKETLLTLKKVNMKLNPKKCSFKMEEGKLFGYIVTFEGIRANPGKAKAVTNMSSPSKLKQMQRLNDKLVTLNRFLSKAAKKALPCLDTLKKYTNKKDFHWRTEAEEAFQEMKKLIADLPTLTAPKKEEELMVYLSTENKAVSTVLLVERHRRQAPIHYVSRTLQGAKIKYPPMEKLVLALVHVARRLRRYFQGHAIKVITDKPISQILNNREATGRLANLGVVASTIHSMIKFPTANWIATVTTKKETFHECRRMEEAQGPALGGGITFSRIPIPDSEETMSTGKEESQGQKKEEGESEDTIQPPPNPPEKDTQTDEEIKGKDEHPKRPVKRKLPEKVVIHDDYPDQTITISGNLSAECRIGLIEILRKHVDAFAWTPIDMTGIPRVIVEHKLKTYTHIELRMQRK